MPLCPAPSSSVPSCFRNRFNCNAHSTFTVAPTYTSTLRPILTLCPFLLLLLVSTASADGDNGCQLDATFDLKLQISFTPSIDPSVDDESSQIPIILAVVHTPGTVIFRVSQRMNDSVAEVASRATAQGIKKWFKSDDSTDRVSDYEIVEETRSGDTSSIPVDGNVDLRLKAKGKATRLTVMVHLSPSPAWFAGLDSYDLCGLNETGTPRFVVFKNLDAGLDKGTSFQADPDPYPQGETVPVSVIDVLENEDTVILSVTRLPPSSGGVAWWIPTIASVTVVVVLALVLFVLMQYRIISKGSYDTGSQMSKPWSGSDRVEW